ncbi:putative ribonuclease H-like domain-containing protein [Tanacetum coccineum]
MTHPSPKRNMFLKVVLIRSGLVSLTTARPGHSTNGFTGQGVIDSGCLKAQKKKPMTGNVLSYCFEKLMEDMLPLEDGLETLNLKTMNKLVKGNLVRGLPSKLFEINQTCVACQKGKDHRASLGFSWVFFLATTDDTSGILKSFITGVENLIDQKVKIIRYSTVEQGKVKRTCMSILVENIPNIAGSGPNWLFVIDALTKSMNYKPVVVGNQSNGNAGTKACDDACKARMKTVPGKDYILLPLWPADLLFSQNSKSSPNAGFKPSGDNEMKVIKEPRKEGGDPSNKNDSVNSTNKINTVSDGNSTTNVNTVSSIVNTVGIEVIAISSNTSIELLNDLNMPELEDIMYSDDYEDVGTEADMNNLNTFMPCLSILNYKITQRSSSLNNYCRLEFRPQQVEWTIEFEWINYDEVFAPVAKIEAIKVFLAYASFKDFVVYQMDVKSAFLYGKFKEEVYVCQPPGFEDLDFPDRVYKVEKALYGLHQAPRAWYETLSTYLLDNRFQRGNIDKTLFIRRDKSDILLVQVYVDDIIFGSTKKSLCIEFENMMHKKFQMSYMGELTFFLGLQVKQKEDGIFISQDKYVTEILKKFGFTDVKTASTPMETQKAFDQGWKMVKLRQAVDRKSTKEGCHFLGFRLISWLCKIEMWLFNSTTKAEYIAASVVVIVDFLNASSIRYALTVNPTIYTLYIEQFWATVKVKTVNGEQQLQALVDGKKIIITEATVRRDLQLEDVYGVDCLPNATIFEQLTLMGYEKLLQKLTFYKAFFSPQWKFLIHTILQCLSAKTTAWNEFSSTMASAIICLATNQKFNFYKYIFKSMVKNLDIAVKFLMCPRFVQVFLNNQVEGMATHNRIYIAPSHTKKIFSNMRRQGKDFSRRETPLFPTMVVQAQKEMGKDEAVTKEPCMQLKELMDFCTKLQQRVLDLENTKTAQAQEITRLKKRVKKLEKKRGSRTHRLKRLYKGRIYDIDADKDIYLVNVHKDDDIVWLNWAQALVALKSAKVQEKGDVIKEPSVPVSAASTKVSTIIPTTTATTITVVSSRPKAKGIVFHEQDQEQEQAPTPIVSSQQSTQVKDKAQEQEELFDAEKATLFVQLLEKRRKYFTAKRAEEKRNRPPTKAQQRSFMCTYLKNMEGWKPKDLKNKSFANIHDLFDKAMKREKLWNKKALRSKRWIEGWKPKDLKNKSFANIQELFDKAMKRNKKALKSKSWKKTKSEELKQCLEIIPDDGDDITIDSTPLAWIALLHNELHKNHEDNMFNDVKLQVDYECEMAFELLRLVKKQLKEGYIPE